MQSIVANMLGKNLVGIKTPETVSFAVFSANSVNSILPYMSAEGEARARGVIRERVRALGRLGLLDANVESEMPVEMVLDGGIVQGVVDVAQVRPDGSVVIRDWKSGERDEYQARYEAQVRFYAEALRRSGRNVEGADIVDVRGSAAAGRVSAVAVDVTPQSTARLVSSLEKALGDIGRADYKPQPSEMRCAACDMARICNERHRP